MRRSRNPRYAFSSMTEVKARRRSRKWQTPEQARAKTERFVRSNPSRLMIGLVRVTAAELKRRHGGQAAGYASDYSVLAPAGGKQRFWRQVADLLKHEKHARNQRRNPGVFATVSEAVRAFKHQYGGQATGWAQDAVTSARSPETARFWQRVLKVLRRDLYARNPRRGRRNPMRDGTPTRGEKRTDKYKDHLRAIRERGQKAADELNKLLGRGAAAPVGHAEPAFKAPKTETQQAHPGHYAPEESSDQKFARQQLANVEALMGDLRDQLRELGDDETLADGLSEQIVKLGKQRKALMDLVKTAEPAVATNPRRRSRRRVRRRALNPARKARYREALRRLRSAVRSLR